jgi:hypothetical protein
VVFLWWAIPLAVVLILLALRRGLLPRWPPRRDTAEVTGPPA